MTDALKNNGGAGREGKKVAEKEYSPKRNTDNIIWIFQYFSHGFLVHINIFLYT